MGEEKVVDLFGEGVYAFFSGTGSEGERVVDVDEEV